MVREKQVQIDQMGDVALLSIHGDVTIHSESFINVAYDQVNSHGANKILFQFQEDAYINSGGISVLIQILRKTRQNKQQIGITGLSDHFKKIFDMVGITKLARIYNTLEEAVEGLGGLGA
jgi:anti-anti-sigma factor